MRPPCLWTACGVSGGETPVAGGQLAVNCGWLVDGQRILKLLTGTPCAARSIGVEISSPPGTVTGEGETPSHPAKDNSGPSGKEKSGATGEEETPSHRCGGNPGPPGTGQTLGPCGLGESPVPAARGKPARVNPGPTGSGKTSKCAAEGKPRVACGEESSGPGFRENFNARSGGETHKFARRRKL